MKFILILLLAVQLYAFSIPNNLRSALLQKGQAKVMINFNNAVDFEAEAKKIGINWDNMPESPRGKLVVKLLKDAAKASQKETLSFLNKEKSTYKQLWISNSIVIEAADYTLLTKLKNFESKIQQVELVEEIQLINDTIEGEEVSKKSIKKEQEIEAGVSWVKAPEVWAKGFKGQGKVVGVIDTGAFLHDDLKKTYRGNKPGYSHKDSWLDATALQRAEPYDDNIHGTHCHGTIGASSDKLVVGVAPESDWISCKFLTARGGGSMDHGIACLQFMLAPGGDSDKRPHIVSNSWGGGPANQGIISGVNALETSGVAVVFAAGNSGNRCRTVLNPAADENIFSVGALNRNADTLARFSSRGPVGFFGRITKPEISAPGVAVLSTSNRGGYRALSGTSMATPHVAGVIALLWNAVDALDRKVKPTYDLLKKTALGQTTTECSSKDSPNNLYGYGTVNTLKAVESEELVKKILSNLK